MTYPNCNREVEATYKKTAFNGNYDTQEYCIYCNPKLAKEFGDEQKEARKLH